MREAIVQLVLFVAVVAVAASLVGVLVTQAGSYAASVEGSAERTADEVGAEIAIVSDAESDVIVDDGTVTLYVQNDGVTTLDPDALDVLLDGTYHEPETTEVLDGERWDEGTVLEVTVDAALDGDTHRALVRIDGASDHLEFEQ